MLDDMRRSRKAIVAVLLLTMAVFFGYSIPVYFKLLALQPDGNAVTPTSFPPAYAFFIGGFYGALTLAAGCGILLLMRWVSRRRSEP